MKRIVIFSAVFPPEPIISAKMSYDIANELSKNNIVSVVCPHPSRPLDFKFTQKDKKLSFKVNVIDSYTCPESKLFGRFRESVSFGRKCKSFIRYNYKDIDVIYMNVWPLFAQLSILRIAMKFHIKVIIHIQDIYPESYTNKLSIPIKQLFQWFLLPIDKYILKNSDHIIAISEKMKEYLMKTRHVKYNKVSVVTNWQDENEFITFHRENNRISNPQKLTFMYLGNIGPVAGIEFLIESFAEAKLSSAKLVIAGSGSMKEYCQKLSLKFPNSDIKFIDVQEGKVPEIQDQADVMLLPIKKGAALSSVPSKLPAYMFSKKPIIGCVDTGSDTANSIFESGCGWVIEPENKKQLIALFKAIYKDNPEGLAIKGEKGFNFAIERFSQKNNLKKITKIIIGI